MSYFICFVSKANSVSNRNIEQQTCTTLLLYFHSVPNQIVWASSWRKIPSVCEQRRWEKPTETVQYSLQSKFLTSLLCSIHEVNVSEEKIKRSFFYTENENHFTEFLAGKYTCICCCLLISIVLKNTHIYFFPVYIRGGLCMWAFYLNFKNSISLVNINCNQLWSFWKQNAA